MTEYRLLVLGMKYCYILYSCLFVCLLFVYLFYVEMLFV